MLWVIRYFSLKQNIEWEHIFTKGSGLHQILCTHIITSHKKADSNIFSIMAPIMAQEQSGKHRNSCYTYYLAS